MTAKKDDKVEKVINHTTTKPKRKSNSANSKHKSSAHYQRQYRQRLREQGLVKKEVWILPEHNKILAKLEKQLREAVLPELIYLDEQSQSEHLNKALEKRLDKDLALNSTNSLVKPNMNTDREGINTENHNSLEAYKHQYAQLNDIGETEMIANINMNTNNLHNPSVNSMAGLYWTTEQLFQSLQKADMFTDGSAKIELIEGSEATILVTMLQYGDLPIFINVAGEQILVEAILFAESEITDKAGFNDLVLRTHKYFPLSTISLDNMGDEDYYQMFGSLSASSCLHDVVLEILLLANNVIQATEAYSEFFKTEKIAS